MASKKDREQDRRLNDNDVVDEDQDKRIDGVHEIISNQAKWRIVIAIELAMLTIGVMLDILFSNWNIAIEIHKVCK